MELDIWDEMRAIERRFDDVARRFLGPRTRIEFPSMPRGFKRPFLPAIDVFARDGDLVIDMEAPGIDPEKDVTVTLTDGDLQIRGERRHSEEVKEENYYRMESSYGSFERHVAVPTSIGPDAIEARYRNGVLEVVVHGATQGLVAEEEEAKKEPAGTKIPITSVSA